MSDNSRIEWTDATWNFIVGCTKVSPGCDNCYAERDVNRWNGEGAFDTVVVKPEKLELPLHWRRPRRIFVNSLSDLFHEAVPNDIIAEAFAVMAVTPRHTYQVLTKRHGRMRALLRTTAFAELVDDKLRDLMMAGHITERACAAAPMLQEGPLPNVWLGVSVEDQKWADIRIPALLETPAAVRFLSCEPLLGPVTLDPHIFSFCRREDQQCPRAADRSAHCPDCSVADQLLDWVICGGESGPSARPMHPDWARRLRDECRSARVAFFFKQWGHWTPDRPALFGGLSRAERSRRLVHLLPDGTAYDGRSAEQWQAGTTLYRARSKHDAGRELDGRTHDEQPDRAAVLV